MKSNLFATVGLTALTTAAVLAQAQTTPTNVRASADPRYAEVIATCKTPPAAARGGGAAPAGRAGAAGAPQGAAAPAGAAAQGAAANQGRGGAAAAPSAPLEYTVTGIPGVIAANQRWTLVWQTTGNNADGILATDDGGLLLAQHDNGAVVKLDRNGQASTVYRDTNTGGALSMNSKGALFVVSRGLNQAVLQLAPQRRVHANKYQGDPFECFGGINDLTADSRGGVYFTMGGLYYSDAKGAVTAYGDNLRTNGVVLSPDEKTLYVTNGAVVVAFDVRPDGSLANQRDFVKMPTGGGDGLAVDSAGRLYVTVGGGGGGAPGLHVVAPDGKFLGTIAGPRNFITAAFAGPDKKTLYAVFNDQRNVEVYTIPMLAEGYKGRAK
jgi:gluconolactonase